jgi:hypothetical protein
MMNKKLLKMNMKNLKTFRKKFSFVPHFSVQAMEKRRRDMLELGKCLENFFSS